MARKKTITKEQILNATYNLVAAEGFSKFTARNIANKMKCSTQPIYLEFDNMEDLKNALFEKIDQRLTDDYYSQVHTGDFVVDLCLNYISFATGEKKLFRTLYVEEIPEGVRVNNYTRKYFLEKIENYPEYSDLSELKKLALLNGVWVVATGLGILASSGFVHPTKEEIVNLIKDVIRSILTSPVDCLLTE